MHPQPLGGQTMAAQEPAGIEPDAGGQARREQLGRRRTQVRTTSLNRLVHRQAVPAYLDLVGVPVQVRGSQPDGLHLPGSRTAGRALAHLTVPHGGGRGPFMASLPPAPAPGQGHPWPFIPLPGGRMARATARPSGHDRGAAPADGLAETSQGMERVTVAVAPQAPPSQDGAIRPASRPTGPPAAGVALAPSQGLRDDPGTQAHPAKLLFEKYFLWKARNGYVRLP